MSDRDRWLLLLAKFQAGECSAEELVELRQLASGDLERIRLLDESRPWLLPDFEASSSVAATQADDLAKLMASFRRERDKVGSETAAVTDAGAVSPVRPTPPARRFSLEAPRRGRSMPRWLGIAAALVVGVGSSVWWLGGRSASRHVGVDLTRTYTTARGERARIVLPDSSSVVLAPESELTYRSSAPNAERIVSLRGEAFLDVHHDAQRSFVVRTPTTITRDIGTAFTVRAYADDPVRVAVQAGQVEMQPTVSMGPGGMGLRLAAGELGIASPRGVTRVAHADLAGFFSWTSGVLSYDHVELRDILKDLGRAYDLDIVITDSALARRPLVVEINGLSPDHALTVVTELVGAKFRRSGRRVVVARR